MKKLVLALVMVLVVMVGRSQAFEGTLQFAIKMDITDPKMKADMEEAKKKAADPANQAKMKALMDQMNDPKMKAMFDANPQMKAQMEAMMKVIAGGDMSSMMPQSITIKLKGINSLTSIHGGFMDKNDVLYLGDKDVTYSINHPAKSYMVNKSSASTTTSTENKPKITKTSETATILGHSCTKYIIETPTSEGKTVTINYWATTDIKDVDMKVLAKQRMGKDQMIFSEIEGVPLRIQSVIPQGSVLVEATDIKKQSLPASDFALPAGYTETKI